MPTVACKVVSLQERFFIGYVVKENSGLVVPYRHHYPRSRRDTQPHPAAQPLPCLPDLKEEHGHVAGINKRCAALPK